LGRDIFFRLWTYQEYHLAKSAVVIVGNDQLSIEEFAPGVVWLGAAVSHGRISFVSGEHEYLGTVHSTASQEIGYVWHWVVPIHWFFALYKNVTDSLQFKGSAIFPVS
jgi:hypothetical protein